MRESKDKKGRSSGGRSIDGIVGNQPRLGQSHSRDGRYVRRPGLSSPAFHPNRNQPSDTLGSSLRRAEGFHSMRPGSGGLGVAAATAESNLLLDEPIVLDEQALSGGQKKTAGKHFIRDKLGLKRLVLIFLALLLAGGMYMGVKFYVLERHLFRGGGGAPALASKVDINKLKGEGDGRINILILGIGGPGHEGQDLTDTIMIASIDPVNNGGVLLSLPRDLWVKVPGDGSEKVNAVYANAKSLSKSKSLEGQEQDGVNALDKTLENVLGITLNYHAVVDFKAFQQAVEAVGGVDANVPKELSAYEVFWVEGTSQHYTLNVQPGQQHFDGTRALYFARERHNDSDFVRGERQRLIISALKDKILSSGTYSNPIKISQLMDGFGNNVYTDFSLSDIKQLYSVVSKVPSNNIVSLDMVTPPHDLLTTGDLNGQSIVLPKAGLYDYSVMQSYIRNAMRDGFLLKENASVAIYNATSTAGMASKEGDLLKSYGYNVTVIDTAPKITEPATTTLVDLSKGSAKYTRHYLEQRLSVTALGSVPTGSGITPPAGTQFVIILGKDAATYTQ